MDITLDSSLRDLIEHHIKHRVCKYSYKSQLMTLANRLQAVGKRRTSCRDLLATSRINAIVNDENLSSSTRNNMRSRFLTLLRYATDLGLDVGFSRSHIDPVIWRPKNGLAGPATTKNVFDLIDHFTVSRSGSEGYHKTLKALAVKLVQIAGSEDIESVFQAKVIAQHLATSNRSRELKVNDRSRFLKLARYASELGIISMPQGIDRIKLDPSPSKPKTVLKVESVAQPITGELVSAVVEATLKFVSPEYAEWTLERFYREFYLGCNPATSPRTIKLYGCTLKKFAKHLGRTPLLADLNNQIVGAYLAELRRAGGLSIASVNKERNHLLAMWNLAKKLDMIRVGPVINPFVEPLRIPKALTVEELKALRASFDKLGGHTGPLRNKDLIRAIFAIQFATAERIGAVTQLRFDDIDNNVITFRAETRKGRRLPKVKKVPDWVVEDLSPISRPERDLLFPGCHGKTKVHLLYDRLFKYAGVTRPRGKSSHLLRSTHATWLWINGGDATYSLGHSSAAVTEKHYLDIRHKPDTSYLGLPDISELEDAIPQVFSEAVQEVRSCNLDAGLKAEILIDIEKLQKEVSATSPSIALLTKNCAGLTSIATGLSSVMKLTDWISKTFLN